MTPGDATVGAIERFMVDDHVRLDGLLAAATSVSPIDEISYARFRQGLLRHIAMEEKVLLPYARHKRGGDPLPLAGALRADHASMAKPLVRSPTMPIGDDLLAILARHNAVEEGPAGLYAACDALAGPESEIVVLLLCDQPKVPVAPYYDGPPHRRA